MKYYLTLVHVIFMCAGLSAQSLPSISGATVVCPGDGGFYFISDSRCAMKTSIDWSVTNGDIGDDSFEVIYVNWDDSEAESGSLKVSYNCWPSLDPEEIIAVEDVTLGVNFKKTQVPFFDSPSLELMIEDNDWFMLITPDQSAGFTYSWTFPECLPGIDGDYYTIVTPDLYATGSICLTVYNELCDTSITECIEITRSCESSKIFDEFDAEEVPAFTSVEQFISTSGNVVTTNPDVEFKAGEMIDLNPGFFANADFLAHIGDCGRAPGSGDCIEPGTFDWFSMKQIKDKEEAQYSDGLEKREEKEKRSWLSKEIKMKISPNPASNSFSIDIDDYDLNQKYTFQILTLNGFAMEGGQILGSKTPIDVSNLSKGMYLVKVRTTNKVSVARLVKF